MRVHKSPSFQHCYSWGQGQCLHIHHSTHYNVHDSTNVLVPEVVYMITQTLHFVVVSYKGVFYEILFCLFIVVSYFKGRRVCLQLICFSNTARSRLYFNLYYGYIQNCKYFENYSKIWTQLHITLDAKMIVSLISSTQDRLSHSR